MPTSGKLLMQMKTIMFSGYVSMKFHIEYIERQIFPVKYIVRDANNAYGRYGE